MPPESVISIARLSAVHDRIMTLRDQLRTGFCDNALRLEMPVYLTLTSLLKEYVKPCAEVLERTIDNRTTNLDRANSTRFMEEKAASEHTTVLEARLVITHYLQDIFAALLYLMPTCELVANTFSIKETEYVNNQNVPITEVKKEHTNIADTMYSFDISCYPAPPLMSPNQSAFYVSNAQRRYCAEVFFYLCFSPLLARHNVFAALYPLLDTFTPEATSTFTYNTTANSEKRYDTDNDDDDNNNCKDVMVQSSSSLLSRKKAQNVTLENAVAPNMLSHKRFAFTKLFVKHILNGLLLSEGKGVRALCRVFVLDDRVEHGAIVEVSQQVIQLLTTHQNGWAWLTVESENANSNFSSSISNSCYVRLTEVSMEMFMQRVCAELVDLYTQCVSTEGKNQENEIGRISEQEQNRYHKPSFIQTLQSETLPSETLEERLHIFLGLLANEMIALPNRNVAHAKGNVTYLHAYKRFYYFNKYFLTPAFVILSLRAACDAKSDNSKRNTLYTSGKSVVWEDEHCEQHINNSKSNYNNNSNNSSYSMQGEWEEWEQEQSNNEFTTSSKNDDVTHFILLSLRRLYCLLHATMCGVSARALLLILESIMPGLLTLTSLANCKPMPILLISFLYKRIWALLLSTEFDAYSQQLAEILVNGSLTCQLRYTFDCDNHINHYVKLCALESKETNSIEEISMRKEFEEEQESNNESDPVAPSATRGNIDTSLIHVIQQIVFGTILAESQQLEEEHYEEQNDYRKVNAKVIDTLNFVYDKREICNNNNSNNSFNCIVTTSPSLQSAVLIKLVSICTAYKAHMQCNDAYNISVYTNATDKPTVSMQRVECALRLIEEICIHGSVESIFGPRASFTRVLEILTMIYPLSAICEDWVLTLLPKILNVRDNVLLLEELKEVTTDTKVAITTVTNNKKVFSNAKRTLIIRKLHVLHEVLSRNTEDEQEALAEEHDKDDSRIVSKRLLALESIKLLIERIEQNEIQETTKRESEEQEEEEKELNDKSLQSDFSKQVSEGCKINKLETKEDQETTASVIIQEWKPLVMTLIWALDTRSTSTVAVSLIQLMHSVDAYTLRSNLSSLMTINVRTFVCHELWPVLTRVLFVCDDMCAITSAIRCLCWLAMYRFDSETSAHLAHTLYICLQPSTNSISAHNNNNNNNNNINTTQVATQYTPLTRFLLNAHLSRMEICNTTYMTRFRLRWLEVLLSLCDYDSENRTLCNVDDRLRQITDEQQESHQALLSPSPSPSPSSSSSHSLYTLLTHLCTENEAPALQITVLHLIGHVVVALYPRVSLRSVCHLCYDVFHHCPLAMAKAACAAMLHTMVDSLLEHNLLNTLEDVDLSEVKLLADAMSCYNVVPTTNIINNTTTITAAVVVTPQGKSVNSSHKEEINCNADKTEAEEHYEIIRHHGKTIVHLLQNLLHNIVEIDGNMTFKNNDSYDNANINIPLNTSACYEHAPFNLIISNVKTEQSS